MHFTPGGSKLLRSNMHWGCKLLRGALYFVTDLYDAIMMNRPLDSYQRVVKTLDRLRQEVYWVSMARNVQQYCSECTKCQQSKLSMPQSAPLTSLPIGRPWQIVAVYILQVPLSTNNNRYLLVCSTRLLHQMG